MVKIESSTNELENKVKIDKMTEELWISEFNKQYPSNNEEFNYSLVKASIACIDARYPGAGQDSKHFMMVDGCRNPRDRWLEECKSRFELAFELDPVGAIKRLQDGDLSITL